MSLFVNFRSLKAHKHVFSKNTWVNAICAVVILAWVLMVNIAILTQIEIIKCKDINWRVFDQYTAPPLKLWGLLLIPSSLIVIAGLYFDSKGRFLKWYVVILFVIFLLLTFATLQILN